MLKLKTTKKHIREQCGLRLAAGYCEMPNLLRYQSPFAYSSGLRGWHCDYYAVDGPRGRRVLVSTGYSPVTSEGLRAELADDDIAKIIQKYDALARVAEGQEATNALLMQLLDEVLPQ